MLNLKSDLGLNYLLKFHCFICSIRRESHLQALKIKGGLSLIRAFTITSTDPSTGHNLPLTASFCISFIITQIDWFKMKEQSVPLRNYPAIGRTCLSISFLHLQRCRGWERTNECLWLSPKADQVALQRSSTSQAQISLQFDVFVLIWLQM